MNKKWIAAIAAVTLAIGAFAAKPKTPSYLIVKKYGDITMASVKNPAAIPADLVIPDGVTYIGSFQYCTSLKSVTIPDSVTTIGDGAFYGCTSLTSITIPESVTTIDIGAFYGCPNSLTVNFGGTKAQWYAIHGNGTKSISVIHCTNGTIDMTQIPAYLVMEGTKIISCDKNKLPDNLVIPEDVTKIGSNAFKGCTSLKSVSIPSSVTTIGADAFKGCTSLTAKFGGTKAQWIVLIGENSKYFSTVHCTDGTFVGMPEIPAYLVMEGTKITGCDKNKLPDNLVIPEGVTEIGESAFQNCTYLESVTIPNSVTIIGKDYGGDIYGVFTGCTSLKSINIPDGIKTIRADTFRNCVSLNNIKIPDSVEWIEASAFENCTSLTNITIPDGVKFGKSAFRGCTSLKSIPRGVDVSVPGIFSECTSLVNVEIPDGTRSIGLVAFGDCSSLTNVTIPNSVTEIGEGAFINCTSLKSVTIPRGVTRIESRTFAYCTSLTVVIPRSVIYIDLRAFAWCGENLKIRYDGTKAQWNAIDGGKPKATVQCTDGNIIY